MNAIAKVFKDSIKIQLPNENLAADLRTLLDETTGVLSEANELPSKLSGKEYETLRLGLRNSIQTIADTVEGGIQAEQTEEGNSLRPTGRQDTFPSEMIAAAASAGDFAESLVTHLETHIAVLRQKSITPSLANRVQRVLDEALGISEKITAIQDKAQTLSGKAGKVVVLYFGTAPRGTDYPHITFMPTSDVPLRIQDADPLSITHWDFKIWGSRAIDVGTIYAKLMNIFNQDDLGNHDAFIVALRGRGLPMMTEVNRPNEIIYSRVVECEVIL